MTVGATISFIIACSEFSKVVYCSRPDLEHHGAAAIASQDHTQVQQVVVDGRDVPLVGAAGVLVPGARLERDGLVGLVVLARDVLRVKVR